MAIMDGMSAAVVLDRMDEMERKLDMITALLGAGGISEHSKSTPARNEGQWSAGYDNGTSAVPKYSETDDRESSWRRDVNNAMEGGELPSGWKKHFDETTGRYFYQNVFNNKVQWDLPQCEASYSY